MATPAAGPGVGSPTPDLPARSLRIVGVGFAVLFLVGAVLERHPDLDALFGLEAYRGRLGLYAIATVVLLAVMLVPGVASAVARLLERATARIPLPGLVLAAAGAALFLLVTNHRLSGDGTTVIWWSAAGRVYPSNALTCYLHQAFDAIPGVASREAVRYADAAAGVVYVLAVLALARECFEEDRTRRVALAALMLTVGSVALFFGSIEVYAPLAAGVAVYLWAGIRHLRGKGRGVLPPLVLGTTFALHGSAGLLLPSLVLLANDGRLRPFRVRRWLAWGGLFLVPVALTAGALSVLTWQGQVPDQSSWQVGNFLGSMGQFPVLPLVRSESNLTHRYAILDVEHLLGVLNLWVLAAPAGLALLWLGRKRLAAAPFALWLASAAAFLAAFPVFWNVSYALRRDWDLFSPAGMPITLLGALAFLARPCRGRTAVALGALALHAFVPFVIANTGTRFDRARYAGSMVGAYETAVVMTGGERREEARGELAFWREREAALDRAARPLAIARKHLAEGRLGEAERELRRVLRIEPDRMSALLDLGLLLWNSGRRDSGRETLERAVRAMPEAFKARFALAETYLIEGDVEEGIRHLERSVRHGTVDSRILRALDRLEEIWWKRGDEARARTMRRLADERRALMGR